MGVCVLEMGGEMHPDVPGPIFAARGVSVVCSAESRVALCPYAPPEFLTVQCGE